MLKRIKGRKGQSTDTTADGPIDGSPEHALLDTPPPDATDPADTGDTVNRASKRKTQKREKREKGPKRSRLSGKLRRSKTNPASRSTEHDIADSHEQTMSGTTSALLGSDHVLGLSGDGSEDTLTEILSREAAFQDGRAYAGLLRDSQSIEEEGDEAHRRDAEQITFDTRASTIFEPIFRWLLVAGLAALVLLILLAAFWIYGLATSTDTAATEAPVPERTPVSATAPTGRAATLAEQFAWAYLAYPAGGEGAEEARGDYLASLGPYLHPEADPALFEPGTADDTPETTVSYASAGAVTEASGENRYKVLVDTRLERGDDGSQTTGTLGVVVKVPPQGANAYVVAPPRFSESPVDEEPGQPGIYGYDEAQTLEDGPLKTTLQDFFEAAYAPEDSRPLVEEEMTEDAALPSFPPESHSYEGIERAAVYYRDNPQQADGAGFERLYDVEVYVRATDEETGRTTLDAWAITAGENRKGGYKITEVS